MDSDITLVRQVYSCHVSLGGRTLEITAMLTRFGGLEVFVAEPDEIETVLWQGSNILEAKGFARSHLRNKAALEAAA